MLTYQPGTFLVDAFDTPPRPPSDRGAEANEAGPSRRRASVPTISTAPIAPPISPGGSGSSTPQLPFRDDPPPEPYECLGGGALYALIGARTFLPSSQLRTLVDRDRAAGDLKPELEALANTFGSDIWVWNEGKGKRMARARIRYEGEARLCVSPLLLISTSCFQYLLTLWPDSNPPYPVPGGQSARSFLHLFKVPNTSMSHRHTLLKTSLAFYRRLIHCWKTRSKALGSPSSSLSLRHSAVIRVSESG